MSQGYAPLSSQEQENYSPPDQNVPLNYSGAGGQVVVQGIPMSNFEIYNPASPQLEKLNSSPYICYQIWLCICVFLDAKAIASFVLALLFGSIESQSSSLASAMSGVFELYVFVLVLQGIRNKDLEKLNKAIPLMKIYLAVIFVLYLIFALAAYGLITELARVEGIREIQNISFVAYGIAVVVILVLSAGFWFFISIFPAMKVREILQTASVGQVNSFRHAHV